VNQYETASPPQTPERNVYLPAGSTWYAFTDNLTPLGPLILGGQSVQNWFAPLNNTLPLYVTPMYVRAGAILPMRELEQYVGQLAENPITLNIYPGPDASFQLYQDDGISNDFQSGKIRLTVISHQGIPGGQRVRVQHITDKYTPPEKFYFIAFPGTNPPASVQAAGSALPNVFNSSALWTATVNSYYYNDGIKTTFLKILDNVSDLTAEVTF
jgi:alpha-glucosidase